ncbi:MAG: DUF975 family protein [Candidatus Pacebacteria bacterium]|nr:DUF975 family protein [Candidatus Paceibacterota bacterium]
MTPTIHVKECLSFGWTTFKSRPWFFVQASAILVGISIVIGVVEDFIKMVSSELVMNIVTTVESTITNTLFSIGTTALFLTAHRNAHEASFSQLWNPTPFWRYLGITFIGGFLTILGLILFIVPGIIIAIAFSFSGILVVEEGMGPIAALKESARLTRGHRMQLFKLGLASAGINILGALALLVGLFVTVPATTLAFVHAYRAITGKESGEELVMVPEEAVTA